MSYLPNIHRSLPQSQEAEQGVLCSILISPEDVMTDCASRITGKHFHHPANAQIYATITELHSNGKPIDLITVTQALRDQNLLDQVGGAVYLTELAIFLPTHANVDFYMDILDEKYDLRKMIVVCTEYASRSYDEQGNAKTLLSEVKEKIAVIGIREEQTSKNQEMESYVNELDRRQKGGANTSILTTGYLCIDTRSGGIYRKNMGVISAKPGVGKSTFGRGIAEFLSLERGFGSLIISVENSYQEIMDTLVSSVAKVPHDELKRQRLNKGQLNAVMVALDRIAKANLHIIANPFISLEGIKSAFRKYKPDFGFIDYIQKLKTPECKEAASREQQLAHMSAELARLSHECDCYVLAGSQETENQKGSVNTKHCNAIIEDTHDWFRLEPVKDEPGLRKLDCMKRRSAESGWSDRLSFLGKFVSLDNHSPQSLH